MEKTRGALFALLFMAFGSPALAGPWEDATAAYERGDYAAAIRVFEPLAKQGHHGAQWAMGLSYQQGRGVPQSFEVAANFYRQSAVEGFPPAQNSLGILLANGLGIPQYFEEAAKWFFRAAEQGSHDAQKNLGVLYYQGHGVPQNFVLAHKWLNLAAAKNVSGAATGRDAAAELMTAAQVAEAQKLAAEWKPKTWTQLKKQLSQ